MALETFPLPYVYEIDKTTSFATKTVVFNSQKKQVQIQSPNSISTWAVKCRGTKEDLGTLEKFYQSHYGNGRTFYFTDELGNQRTCHFSDNKMTLKVYRDFNPKSKTHGNVVGFEATVNIEEAL